MSGAEIAVIGAAIAGVVASERSRPKKVKPPPPVGAPPSQVDVEPSRDAERRRLKRTTAANTLLTGDFLEPPTLLRPGL